MVTLVCLDNLALVVQAAQVELLAQEIQEVHEEADQELLQYLDNQDNLALEI